MVAVEKTGTPDPAPAVLDHFSTTAGERSRTGGFVPDYPGLSRARGHPGAACIRTRKVVENRGPPEGISTEAASDSFQYRARVSHPAPITRVISVTGTPTRQ